MILATPDSTESLNSVQLGSQPSASPTPYLDRKLLLPGPNWGYRPIRPWQTALIIGAFLLRTPFEIYLLVLALVLVHELGHYLAGLAVGLELDRIRVGPLELDSYKRLHWEWNRGTLVSGHAVMLPRTKSALPGRLAAYLVGGPTANVVCGLWVLHTMPTRNLHFMGLAQLFVAGSFVIGVGNLIPFRRYGVTSDGMKLVLLLLNKGQRWISLLIRRAAFKRGEIIAKQEIDPLLVGKSDGSSDYVGANWAMYTSADAKGEYEQAAKHLDVCLSKCNTVDPSFRVELMLAAARFQASRRRRNDLARQWLNSPGTAKSKVNHAYTEALILFSEGKVGDSLTKADQVSELVSQLPPGRLRSLHELAARQLKDVIGKDPRSSA